MYFLPHSWFSRGGEKERTDLRKPTSYHCQRTLLFVPSRGQWAYPFRSEATSFFLSRTATPSVSVRGELLSPSCRLLSSAQEVLQTPFILPSLFYLLLQPRHPKSRTAWKEWPLHFFYSTYLREIPDIRYVFMGQQDRHPQRPSIIHKGWGQNSLTDTKKTELSGSASQVISWWRDKEASTKLIHDTHMAVLRLG